MVIVNIFVEYCYDIKIIGFFINIGNFVGYVMVGVVN